MQNNLLVINQALMFIIYIFIVALILGCNSEVQFAPKEIDDEPDEIINEIIFVSDQSLILHLPINESIVDSSENQFDVEIHGSPILSADRHGLSNQAISLTENSDFLEIKHHNALNLANDYTIAVWINPISTSSKYIFHKGFEVNGGGPYSLDIFPGMVRSILSYSGNSTEELVGPNEIKASEWQHLALTKNDNVIRLYYNGEVVDVINVNSEIVVSNSSLYIGTYFYGYSIGGSVTFNGQLDDIKIYDFGLSKEEIDFIMTN